MSTYRTLDPALVKRHYQRPEILAAMVEASTHKECVGSFGGSGYAKRPNVIEYPQDILEEVKNGVTSFHASEELWSNPLSISTSMTKAELGKLRIGWDLVLDIDCKELAYSQVASDIIYQLLSFHGIKSVGCKFSGNHGFHFIVPFEAFPVTYRDTPTKLLFPDVARAIAEYLMHTCAHATARELLAFESGGESIGMQELLERIAKKVDKPVDKITNKAGEIDAFSVVGIDTVLITSRHLYRQVYSINEKSGLVSLPINPAKIRQFKKELANLEDLRVSKYTFLDRKKAFPNEAKELLVSAYDYYGKKKSEEPKKMQPVFSGQTTAEFIPEQFFPPVIQALLKPLQDGKKRAMFILARFLKMCGHPSDDIVKRMTAWNAAHPEPMRETYFLGQLKYIIQGDILFPPNYDNSAYKDIVGEELLSAVRAKNPYAEAKFAFERYMRIEKDEQAKEMKKKLKEEKKKQKEEQAQKKEAKKVEKAKETSAAQAVSEQPPSETHTKPVEKG